MNIYMCVFMCVYIYIYARSKPLSCPTAWAAS